MVNIGNWIDIPPRHETKQGFDALASDPAARLTSDQQPDTCGKEI